MTKKLLLIMLFGFAQFAYSQTTEIQGTILDDETEEPLIGATVRVVGTQTAAITDLDGNFRLSATTDQTISVAYIGYISQAFKVSDKDNFTIRLAQSMNDLNEVVVVGYGTQKKSTLTGSVTDIKADDVVQTPTANVKGLIVGQVPGLITNQNPGLPGQDNTSLSIRGFGEPLVIVDGIESFMDRIDPNDIESISVLKDASAAIYGARAGNGVILVTTKRGNAGKTKLSYHGYFSTQKRIKFPEPTDAAGYIKVGRDAIFNGQYNPANPDAPIGYGTFTEELQQSYENGELPSYNWADALVKTSGSPLTNHNLSIRGGNEKVRFYSSAGILKQNSIFNGDYEYDKMTFTNNMDVDITNNLTFNLNASYIYEDLDYAAIGISDIWNDLRTAQPIYNPYLPDDVRGAAFSGFSERSPLARANKDLAGFERTRRENLSVAGQLDYALPWVEGLKIGGRINARIRSVEEDRQLKSYTVYRFDETLVTEDFNGYVPEGTILNNSFSRSITGNPKSRILTRGYLTYDKEINDHNIRFLAFGEKEDNIYRSLRVNRRELLSQDILEIGGNEELTSTGGTGRSPEYTRVSFAGRVNYDFDERYLFEATLRSDASSKFAPGVRWGYFPSFSAGWNVANENFMENVRNIDQLKVRLSYSQTGLDNNVGNTSFEYLSGFVENTGAVYIINDVPTTIIDDAGLINSNLTWEETTLYNAALDLTMFDGKLYSTTEYFYRKRDGLLRRPLESLPSTFGANLPLVNLDARSNRGFEFSLGYQNNIGEFRYDLLGGVAFARERYEKYQEDIDESDPYQVEFIKRTGRWVNVTFGYKTDGLFNSQEEVDNYLETYTFEDLNGSPKPGDIKYVDNNGDGIINRLDRYQIGYGGNPDVTYTFAPKLSYKNFSFNMLWQGGTRFNVNVAGNLRAAFNNEQVPLTIHEQYTWRQDPSNPGVGANPNAQLPAFERSGTRQWNNTGSDFWMYNGTYVRLKAANLVYNLPNKTMKKMKLSRASFYLSGDNIASFSNLGVFDDALDPEEQTNANAFAIPLMRSLSLGIQLGL